MTGEQLDLLTPLGDTFDPRLDADRLGAQARRVWDCVRSGGWWTLRALADATESPEASVSARLRDLRRLGVVVDRERVTAGLWRYRVVV